MSNAAEQHAYGYSELSPAAKKRAEEYVRQYMQDDRWWESIYRDATFMGEKIGLTIDKIMFSGFYSQGDGASFIGSYRPRADAVLAIKEECNDIELLRIAEELTRLQLVSQLLNGRGFAATITRVNFNRYVHEMTMDIDIYQEDDCAIGLEGPNTERAATLIRDFARWIYKQLDDANEYLNSDEAVLAYIHDYDYWFDELGTII